MEENFAANVEIKTPPRVPTLPKESYQIMQKIINKIKQAAFWNSLNDRALEKSDQSPYFKTQESIPSLAEPTPQNRFLGSMKVYKYRLDQSANHEIKNVLVFTCQAYCSVCDL